jgi:hypothetical protein
MRRILVFAVAALAVGIVATPAAADRARATDSSPSFCRAVDGFLKFFAKSPDPKAFASKHGTELLRVLAARSPREVVQAAATIRTGFTHLSRHGRGSLDKRRDAALGSALFRLAVVGASQCSEHRVKAYASALATRRLAQAQADRKRASATTSTTPAR